MVVKKNDPYRILNRWRIHHLAWVVALLLIVGIGFVLLDLFSDVSTTMITVGFLLLVVGLGLLAFKSLPQMDDLLSLANIQHDDLQYSSSLIIATKSQLNSLQKIQKEEILNTFYSSKFKFPIDVNLIKKGATFSLLLMGLIYSISLMSFNSGSKSEQKDSIGDSLITPTNSDTCYFEYLDITVRPPAYTNLRSTTPQDPSLIIPEGSEVKWKLNIVGQPSKVSFIINGIDSSDITETRIFNNRFNQSGFYQYKITKKDGDPILSPFYPIKVNEDTRPSVEINGIEEYQRLPFREDYSIDFNININDNYGLQEATISATVAKGSGESVKFREKQFPLNRFKKGSKSYKGTYHFSTKDLDMEPGSELYFYVAAKDNCPFRDQWTKSLTYFVILEDTITYDYADDGGSQVDLMPDFFRSQRQIIIDSEKLLAEKNKIEEAEFNHRSNELGYDQKMLRLKYGQFLGEESESGIDVSNDPEEPTSGDENQILDWGREVLEEFGHDHDHEDEPNQLLETKGTQKKEDPSKPSWVMALSHNHDNMEEATFYDLSVKSKLRAALTEMWDAELHLRLYDPKKSLPYQYKALQLLQEIKNHARIYVHRIGFDPPAIKETEVRLSGELDEIKSPTQKYTLSEKDQFTAIKKGLEVLISVRSASVDTLNSQQHSILTEAAREISIIALENPQYLPALALLQKISAPSGQLKNKEINLLEKIFLDVIPEEPSKIKTLKYYAHPINASAIKSLNGQR